MAGPIAPAVAESPRVTPCVYPDGTDIQAKYGVSTSLVLPNCTQIKSGAAWAIGIGWFAAKTWEHVPAGYTPVGATPIADFTAHLVAARFVIDEGTPQAFTVDWPNSPALWTGQDGDYDLANVITLGTIRPLPVGAHTVKRQLVLSAMTCDGTSSDPDVSCAPAGVLTADSFGFDVVR